MDEEKSVKEEIRNYLVDNVEGKPLTNDEYWDVADDILIMVKKRIVECLGK